MSKLIYVCKITGEKQVIDIKLISKENTNPIKERYEFNLVKPKWIGTLPIRKTFFHIRGKNLMSLFTRVLCYLNAQKDLFDLEEKKMTKSEWVGSAAVHEWEDKWWFWDETAARIGPFLSKEVAKEELEEYVKWLDGEEG